MIFQVAGGGVAAIYLPVQFWSRPVLDPCLRHTSLPKAMVSFAGIPATNECSSRLISRRQAENFTRLHTAYIYRFDI